MVREVKPVSEGLSPALAAEIASVPQLSEVIFKEGIDTVATAWSAAGEVLLEIYPNPDVSSIIVRVDGKIYATIKISAGPPMEYYIPLGRDSRGVPQYDTYLAGRSDPGRFSLMGITDHYLSQTYSFTTAMPQGAELHLTDSGWVWTDSDGSTQPLSPVITAELELLRFVPPPGQRLVIRKGQGEQLEYAFCTAISEKEWDGTLETRRSPVDVSAGSVTYKPFPPAIARAVMAGFDFSTYPAGTMISQNSGSNIWMLIQPREVNTRVAPRSAAELNFALSTSFIYYDIEQDSSGNVIAAKWGSNDFSKWVFVFERDGTRSGEVIHSTPIIDGDLRRLTDITASIMLQGWEASFRGNGEVARDLTFYRNCSQFVTAFASQPSVEQAGIDKSLVAYYRLFNGVAYDALLATERYYIPLEEAAAFKLVVNYQKTGRWDSAILTAEERQALDASLVDGTKDGRLTLNATACRRITGIYFSMYEKASCITKYSEQYRLLETNRTALEAQGKLISAAFSTLCIPGGYHDESRRLLTTLLLSRLDFASLSAREIGLLVTDYYQIAGPYLGDVKETTIVQSGTGVMVNTTY